jgi:chromosome segregation protein
MRLKHIELVGFKSFAKKSTLVFSAPVTAVVGPNGSGKSNVVEAFRFVLGEQSIKSMRGKSGSDLIFRGGVGSPKISRAAVSIVFDNSDKVFNFSSDKENKALALFDTVTFMREIFADGTSKYSLNGTEIKLKQMAELLGSVHIGSSSHHIISQGEADGVLRANAKDRREIIEDALGLKVYHSRIKESELKLGRTRETLKEVQALRKELAPHIVFLKKQVEKIEKGKVIRNELEECLIKFLSIEKADLFVQDSQNKESFSVIQKKKVSLEQELNNLPQENNQTDYSVSIIQNNKQQVFQLQETRRSFEQKISRLEGTIEAHRSLSNIQNQQIKNIGPSISFAPTEYQQLLSDIEFFVSSIKNATSLEMVQLELEKLAPLISRLKARQPQVALQTKIENNSFDIRETVLELESLQKELSSLIAKEESLLSSISNLELEREQSLKNNNTNTESKYRLISEIKQCESELQILSINKNSFLQRKENFDQEIKEAGFLFGVGFIHKLHAAQVVQGIDMHELQRNIDRLKIRLEDHSGIGNDVVAEYETTSERDAFLHREMIDIETSSKNLEKLIIDLKKSLDEQFVKGVEVINQRFGEFFKIMFGGGSAFLSITIEKKKKRKDDTVLLNENELEEISDELSEGFERGIEVHVSLPSKKVKELTMLSGGERSLVSIALLFAISQVNPPPFLVLDETDAALDEANARRYGDMVERLSEYSQLIVVTHNRETMSRATVLYGVTLGSDSGSKLLSIKFDEAVKVAK